MQPISKFRDDYIVANKYAYFDCAALGPLSITASVLMEQWSRQQAQSGSVHWLDWFSKMNQAITLSAQLIGARDSEIALIRSTSEGVKLVAEGYRWQAGDNVVLPENEFPANAYPWLYLQGRGVEVRRVPVPNGHLTPDVLAPYLDSKTKIVSLSWVGFSTGWRADLKAFADMAHANGSLLFVDAIQGLGAFELNVRKTGIDFMTAGAQKWLLSAQGSGLFYCRAALVPTMKNINYGWCSVVDSQNGTEPDHDELPNAQRFMTATTNTPAWLSMFASLTNFARYDKTELSDYILNLRQYTIEKLHSIGGVLLTDIPESIAQEHASGIVTFGFSDVLEKDYALIRKKCVESNIILSCRGGGLRVALHAYNNQSDVDRLINCLSKIR